VPATFDTACASWRARSWRVSGGPGPQQQQFGGVQLPPSYSEPGLHESAITSLLTSY
jgi:hypothetical protein